MTGAFDSWSDEQVTERGRPNRPRSTDLCVLSLTKPAKHIDRPGPDPSNRTTAVRLSTEKEETEHEDSRSFENRNGANECKVVVGTHRT